jgi:hypothetical protein
MTKVRMSPSVLLYRQAMAELVNQVCEEKLIVNAGRERMEGLLPDRTDTLEFWTPGLLRAPKIELLWPEIRLKDGHLDGIIQIHTSEYYGVMNVYVILEDDRGNHIESDYAMDNQVVENHWGYIPSAPLASGTTVVVRAIAMDRLGGVGIQTESITV